MLGESSNASPWQEPTELERAPRPLNESRAAIAKYPPAVILPTARAVDHN